MGWGGEAGGEAVRMGAGAGHTHRRSARRAEAGARRARERCDSGEGCGTTHALSHALSCCWGSQLLCMRRTGCGRRVGGVWEVGRAAGRVSEAQGGQREMVLWGRTGRRQARTGSSRKRCVAGRAGRAGRVVAAVAAAVDRLSRLGPVAAPAVRRHAGGQRVLGSVLNCLHSGSFLTAHTQQRGPREWENGVQSFMLAPSHTQQAARRDTREG